MQQLQICGNTNQGGYCYNAKDVNRYFLFWLKHVAGGCNYLFQFNKRLARKIKTVQRIFYMRCVRKR